MMEYVTKSLGLFVMDQVALRLYKPSTLVPSDSEGTWLYLDQVPVTEWHDSITSDWVLQPSPMTELPMMDPA